MHLLSPLLLPTLTFLAASAHAFESITPAAGKEKEFIVYDAENVHYPFTVHLPDRTTRNLPALTTPPPLLLSLSGSGARGPASKAATLSGYDGASRKIRFYNSGKREAPNCQAAEEFLIVTPIAPDEGDQHDANWDADALIPILTRAASMYEVDLSRVYLSTYSMGSRVAWNLLINHSDIFAGAVIASGRTMATPDKLQDLLGIPIRNYIGAVDESNIDRDTATLGDNYASAMSQAKAAGKAFNESRTLVNVPAIPGADHLAMNERPWDEDVLTDGYAGASAWLLTQSRPELANIPGLESAGYSALAQAPTAQNMSSQGTSVYSNAAQGKIRILLLLSAALLAAAAGLAI